MLRNCTYIAEIYSEVSYIRDEMRDHPHVGITNVTSGSLARLHISNQFRKEKIVCELIVFISPFTCH